MELPTTKEGMESYPLRRSYSMGDHIESDPDEFTPRKRLYSRSDVEGDLEGIKVTQVSSENEGARKTGGFQWMKNTRTFFSARFRNSTLSRWLPGFHAVADESANKLEEVEPKPIHIAGRNAFQADESTKKEISDQFQEALNKHFSTPDSPIEVLGNAELDDQQGRGEQEYLYNFPITLEDGSHNQAIYEHMKKIRQTDGQLAFQVGSKSESEKKELENGRKLITNFADDLKEYCGDFLEVFKFCVDPNTMALFPTKLHELVEVGKLPLSAFSDEHRRCSVTKETSPEEGITSLTVTFELGGRSAPSSSAGNQHINQLLQDYAADTKSVFSLTFRKNSAEIVDPPRFSVTCNRLENKYELLPNLHYSTVVTSKEEILGAENRGGKNVVWLKATIPKSASFQGGVSERERVSDALNEQVLKPISSPYVPVQNDLKNKDETLGTVIGGNTQCIIDSRVVTTVTELKSFCGDAADAIIKMMSQNIGAVAKDTIHTYLSKDAPVDGIYGVPEEIGSQGDKSQNLQRFEIKKKTNLNGSEGFMVKFYTQGALGSVYRKKASGPDQIDLGVRQLEAIGGFEQDEKKLVVDSKKTAEIAATFELVKKEEKSDGSLSYSINCIELSNSYKITKPPKWFRFIRNFVTWKR
jgi:hypothetical protein